MRKLKIAKPLLCGVDESSNPIDFQSRAHFAQYTEKGADMPPLSRREFLRLLAAFTDATLLAACGISPAPISAPISATPLPTPQPTGRGSGGTLRLLYWQAPATLNPHLSANQADWDAGRVTYEPLADFDKSANLIPFLAEEIPSLDNGGVATDGKSVTWKLKKDVKWSDDQAFTADDVLFTYQFATNPAVQAKSIGTFAAVKSVDVVDPYTVRVNFKDVTPGWAVPFVGSNGVILPRHVFEAYNNENAAKAPANLMPIGTGPYKVSAFILEEVLFLGSQLVQTNRIIYDMNPLFREQDKPFFSRVDLKGGAYVTEAARQVFEIGQIDFALNLQMDAAKLQQIADNGKLGRILSVFGPRVERIVVNLSDPNPAQGERSSVNNPHPFLSDKLVRQAFAHAIDREAIATLYGPFGRATNNMLVAPPIYASTNNAGYDYDLAKAATLLDQAGWKDTNNDGIRDKNGVPMKIVFQTTANNALRTQTLRLIQQSLEKLQISVRLDFPPDFATGYIKFFADLEEFSGLNSLDPQSYMQTNWSCDAIPQEANKYSGGNYARWCNDQYTQLLTQSAVEIDPAKRSQYFIQMNDLIVSEVAAIPLVNLALVSGVGNTMDGVDPSPWSSSLWNIKDWRRNS
jgi:peptide/nickel transport system substrate-binding protein